MPKIVERKAAFKSSTSSMGGCGLVVNDRTEGEGVSCSSPGTAIS